jgi:hypothetical protein
VLYRVNAGGAALTGSPAWSADTAAAPSPYVNAAATGNTPYLTATPINQRLHRGCADAVVSTSADAGATGVAASAIVAATSSEAIW